MDKLTASSICLGNVPLLAVFSSACKAGYATREVYSRLNSSLPCDSLPFCSSDPVWSRKQPTSCFRSNQSDVTSSFSFLFWPRLYRNIQPPVVENTYKAFLVPSHWQQSTSWAIFKEKGKNKMKDKRGVVRGRCLECDCDEYETQNSIAACDYCGHAPGQHLQATAVASSEPQHETPTVLKFDQVCFVSLLGIHFYFI